MDIFSECLEGFTKCNEDSAKVIQQAVKDAGKKVPRQVTCKHQVSLLLLTPKHTEEVAKWFSPVLLELLSLGVEKKHGNTEEVYVALSKIIRYPQVKSFALNYFSTHPNPIESHTESVTLRRVQAAYWLVRHGHFQWDWRGILSWIEDKYELEIRCVGMTSAPERASSALAVYGSALFNL